VSLYPKIYGPYKRHTEGSNKNELIIGSWTQPEFPVLSMHNWTWTEKVDGTNIRVMWDGHKVEFGGRTDNALIPAQLFRVLQEEFPEELFEQHFKDQPVTLYGEGFGPKIQKVGHLYGDLQDFVLFDVRVGKWWLSPEDVAGIAKAMGVGAVPVVGEMTPFAAMRLVSHGLNSQFGDRDFYAEGVVGRAPCGLLTRGGERIIMKVKHVDFFERDAA